MFQNWDGLRSVRSRRHPFAMSLFGLQTAIHRIYRTSGSIAHEYAVVGANGHDFPFIKLGRVHVSFSS